MPKTWNKKILTVLMQWDYGDKSRGVSMEKTYFHDNLRKLAANVEPFWYDEYLNDLPRLQKLVLEKAAAYGPDLIYFMPSEHQFSVETLDLLKKRWPTCVWFGDDTWRFDSYSSKLAPHFSFVATTDPYSVEKYRKLGVEPILTQLGAQLSAGDLGPLPPPVYDHEVSFVGGRNNIRAWFISRLEKLGIEVKCFGAGWPAGKVSFADMDLIFRKSRINLNLSNSLNHDIRFVFGGPRNFATYLRSTKFAEQIKARNFEIPLAGGFQLTNYVAGLERYLKVGEEVAVFATPEECAQQIRYYLGNEAERLAILSAGTKRAERELTYLSRLQEMLGHIWK